MSAKFIMTVILTKFTWVFRLLGNFKLVVSIVEWIISIKLKIMYF